jgi:hypothetical protein
VRDPEVRRERSRSRKLRLESASEAQTPDHVHVNLGALETEADASPTTREQPRGVRRGASHGERRSRRRYGGGGSADAEDDGARAPDARVDLGTLEREAGAPAEPTTAAEPDQRDEGRHRSSRKSRERGGKRSGRVGML